MIGIFARSGFCIGRGPSSMTLPLNWASARVLTIFVSSMPSAREREVRLAVRFITAREPPILWKKRSLSVPAAIFGASMSTETSSFTSTTSPAFRIFSINSRIVTAPALYEVVFYFKVVEHAGHDHVHEIVDLLRLVVKPGACGHDHRSSVIGGKHILQVDLRERHLSGDEDSFPGLLEADIGSACDQVVGIPVRYRRKGLGTAGYHYHPVVLV